MPIKKGRLWTAIEKKCSLKVIIAFQTIAKHKKTATGLQHSAKQLKKIMPTIIASANKQIV